MTTEPSQGIGRELGLLEGAGLIALAASLPELGPPGRPGTDACPPFRARRGSPEGDRVPRQGRPPRTVAVRPS